MKRANVYRRDGAWYINAMSQTTAGVWIGTDPHLKESSDESAVLGQAILAALKGSTQSLPHPTKWGNVFKPVLELAGVKTWNQFMLTATCVSIGANDSRITIEPSSNAGPQTGYTPLPDKKFQIPRHSTAKDIGDAVKQAITLCE